MSTPIQPEETQKNLACLVRWAHEYETERASLPKNGDYAPYICRLDPAGKASFAFKATNMSGIKGISNRVLFKLKRWAHGTSPDAFIRIIQTYEMEVVSLKGLTATEAAKVLEEQKEIPIEEAHENVLSLHKLYEKKAALVPHSSVNLRPIIDTINKVFLDAAKEKYRTSLSTILEEGTWSTDSEGMITLTKEKETHTFDEWQERIIEQLGFSSAENEETVKALKQTPIALDSTTLSHFEKWLSNRRPTPLRISPGLLTLPAIREVLLQSASTLYVTTMEKEIEKSDVTITPQGLFLFSGREFEELQKKVLHELPFPEEIKAMTTELKKKTLSLDDVARKLSSCLQEARFDSYKHEAAFLQQPFWTCTDSLTIRALFMQETEAFFTREIKKIASEATWSIEESGQFNLTHESKSQSLEAWKEELLKKLPLSEAEAKECARLPVTLDPTNGMKALKAYLEQTSYPWNKAMKQAVKAHPLLEQTFLETHQEVIKKAYTEAMEHLLGTTSWSMREEGTWLLTDKNQQTHSFPEWQNILIDALPLSIPPEIAETLCSTKLNLGPQGSKNLSEWAEQTLQARRAFFTQPFLKLIQTPHDQRLEDAKVQYLSAISHAIDSVQQWKIGQEGCLLCTIGHKSYTFDDLLDEKAKSISKEAWIRVRLKQTPFKLSPNIASALLTCLTSGYKTLSEQAQATLRTQSMWHIVTNAPVQTAFSDFVRFSYIDKMTKLFEHAEWSIGTDGRFLITHNGTTTSFEERQQQVIEQLGLTEDKKELQNSLLTVFIPNPEGLCDTLDKAKGTEPRAHPSLLTQPIWTLIKSQALQSRFFDIAQEHYQAHMTRLLKEYPVWEVQKDGSLTFAKTIGTHTKTLTDLTQEACRLTPHNAQEKERLLRTPILMDEELFQNVKQNVKEVLRCALKEPLSSSPKTAIAAVSTFCQALSQLGLTLDQPREKQLYKTLEKVCQKWIAEQIQQESFEIGFFSSEFQLTLQRTKTAPPLSFSDLVQSYADRILGPCPADEQSEERIRYTHFVQAIIHPIVIEALRKKLPQHGVSIRETLMSEFAKGLANFEVQEAPKQHSLLTRCLQRDRLSSKELFKRAEQLKEKLRQIDDYLIRFQTAFTVGLLRGGALLSEEEVANIRQEISLRYLAKRKELIVQEEEVGHITLLYEALEAIDMEVALIHRQCKSASIDELKNCQQKVLKHQETCQELLEQEKSKKRPTAKIEAVLKLCKSTLSEIDKTLKEKSLAQHPSTTIIDLHNATISPTVSGAGAALAIGNAVYGDLNISTHVEQVAGGMESLFKTILGGGALGSLAGVASPLLLKLLGGGGLSLATSFLGVPRLLMYGGSVIVAQVASGYLDDLLKKWKVSPTVRSVIATASNFYIAYQTHQILNWCYTNVYKKPTPQKEPLAPAQSAPTPLSLLPAPEPSDPPPPFFEPPPPSALPPPHSNGLTLSATMPIPKEMRPLPEIPHPLPITTFKVHKVASPVRLRPPHGRGGIKHLAQSVLGVAQLVLIHSLFSSVHKIRSRKLG